MKLTELSIDGFGVCRNLNLGRFHDGLNVVYGETGAGKSTVRQFVRGIFYGFGNGNPAHSFMPQMVQGTKGCGHLHVEHHGSNIEMFREWQIPAKLTIHPSPGSAFGGNYADLDQLTGGLSAELFDTFYSVGFHQTDHHATTIANHLNTRLGVPMGTDGIRDEVGFRRWQQEREALQMELASIQSQIDSLTDEKRGYQEQLKQAAATQERQLASLNHELSQVSAQLSSLEVEGIEADITHLKSEISRLREYIADAEARCVPTTIPVATNVDGHSHLYQRLDEIDSQIRRWRRVQSDIQNQRVRLRDEMLVWNEMTLDSDEHPYHNARRILVSMEAKVEQAEAQLRSVNSGNINSITNVRQLDDFCARLRNDIYGLCQELGSQYKHIRHKAAAAELKQLRRCYNEMGENTDRLVQRRASVIEEIRQIDPAGAEAIVRADNQFCQCAQHEGYLNARRKYVGSPPATVTQNVTTLTPVQPNLERERHELSVLEIRLSEQLRRLDEIEHHRSELRVRHSDLVSQRDRLLAQNGRPDLHAKIENIDIELRQLTERFDMTNRRFAQLKYIETPPNAILESAAKYLQRVSMGDLSQVWLDTVPGCLMVDDRASSKLRFDALSRGHKDLVCLSLCLAVADSMKIQGKHAPMLLDDVFANLDNQRVHAVLEVLRERGRIGNQMFVFAKKNELPLPVNRDHIVILELPQTGVSTQPFVQPERQSTLPGRNLPWESAQDSETRFYHTYRVPEYEYSGNEEMIPRTYPLTKYSAVEPPLSETQAILDSGPVVAPVSRDEVHPWTESTSIAFGEIVEPAYLNILKEMGIVSIGNLLDVNVADMASQFARMGIQESQLERWQSLYSMLMCVPTMKSVEVKVLAACGITEPEQLDTIYNHQLEERVERYLQSHDGRTYRGRVFVSSYIIDAWQRTLRASRSNWSSYTRFRRNRRRSSPQIRQYEPQENQSTARETRRVARPDLSKSEKRTTRTSRSRRTRQETTPTTPLVQNFTEKQRQNRPATTRESGKQSALRSSDGAKLKFYLDLNDHVEAAPSIGPRTAERFEKIGIVTVGEFLKNTAESMAAKINYKRITADVIRDWQNQTRLVCRIPNLRGHDAQLLVACGITEPEDISVMQPDKLFDIIGPFSETKEGLKIIRSGKKPDLDEIKDWIEWAGHTRSLQAA